MIKPYILFLICCIAGLLPLRAATPRDTLADLNGMLGGITRIQLSKEKPLPLHLKYRPRAGLRPIPQPWSIKYTFLSW